MTRVSLLIYIKSSAFYCLINAYSLTSLAHILLLQMKGVRHTKLSKHETCVQVDRVVIVFLLNF